MRLFGLCVVAGVLVAGVASPVAVGLGDLSGTASASADVATVDLSATQMPQVTTVTDRDGTPIATLFQQYRLPVSFDQISQAMRSSIVSIEDRRFWSDGGVDPTGMLRAMLHDTGGGGGDLQGASTITQQYVKNYLINIIDRNNPVAQHDDQSDTIAR